MHLGQHEDSGCAHRASDGASEPPLEQAEPAHDHRLVLATPFRSPVPGHPTIVLLTAGPHCRGPTPVAQNEVEAALVGGLLVNDPPTLDREAVERASLDLRGRKLV